MLKCSAAVLVLAVAVQAAPAADIPASDPRLAAQAGQLQDKDPLVRLRAARALGEMGLAAAPAMAALERLAHDPDDDVRMIAARAVAQIRAGVKANLDQLIASLGDPDAAVRLAAARSLAALGQTAGPALAPLRRRLKDPDIQVRQEVQKGDREDQRPAPFGRDRRPDPGAELSRQVRTKKRPRGAGIARRAGGGGPGADPGRHQGSRCGDSHRRPQGPGPHRISAQAADQRSAAAGGRPGRALCPGGGER